MRGESVLAGLLVAGALLAAPSGATAATVSLPTDHTTLYLAGDLSAPVWVTFDLDADIELSPVGGSGPVSFYILNIALSNAGGTTDLQFAEIEGAAVENGVYPDGPPRLMFSGTDRFLHIDPEALSFSAALLGANLSATLPDELYFTSSFPDGASPFAETPLPGAVWLFGSAIAGASGVAAWRRRRARAAA